MKESKINLMECLGGGGEVARNNAMLVYPKMMGANPSERWGHSACYFNGLIYIFGGCRGGVHFSDVLVCNLATMSWNILKTTGQGPGPRDSHSAVLVGHKMLVFGGSNGCRKVNDFHILDLLSREWARPECHGDPPCARESHTANVVGDEKMVIFGGSGEGEANYLNDLHVLDLNTMEWSSPEVKGSVPAPRDSHTAVAVGHRLFMFGGDSGYRSQGDVNVLDMNKVVWSKLDTHGASPGARAGHAAVSIGTKVYVLGGVGDKPCYNDIWVLDVITSSWVQLDINSPKSQGRFSHTATVTNLGIAIFGGCGEDERPLNELLVLQIDSQTCRAFGNTYKEEIKKISLTNKAENNLKKTIFVVDNEDSTSQQVEELELVPKQAFRFGSGRLHPKRRRTSNSKQPEDTLELQEHSISLSQQSSPSSQSDHEQATMQKNMGNSYSSPRVHMMFRQNASTPNCFQPPSNQASSWHAVPTTFPERYPSLEHPNKVKPEHKNVICSDACRVQCNAAESLSLGKTRNLMGAEVRGQVDGTFDSGYLMTATVNGKVFRGVLFAAGPDLGTRGATLSHHPHASPRASNVQNHAVPIVASPRHPVKVVGHVSEQAQLRRSSPERRASLPIAKESRAKTELQGVVLTLASPGSDRSRI